MALAYESSHIIQIVVPLPTIFVVYYVVAATPALAIVTGIGQMLLSVVLTLLGVGSPLDTAAVLIPTMVILNAVGIAHVAKPWGRENASFVEPEFPVRTSQAVISPETVKWHTSRIYRKLGVSSRIQLVQRVLGDTDVPSSE